MSIYSKICTKCKISKSNSEFYKASTKDGYSGACKSCYHVRIEINYDNSDIILYSQEQINQINELRKQELLNKAEATYKKSASTRRKTRRDYMAKKLKEDSLFKLKHNIKNLIRNSINNNGFGKNTKTHQILGCSFQEFKIYIENQFTEGMSWDNYGEWEYDHMTPISWANTESKVIELNHYSNFQPLWKKDNIDKSNKFSSRAE